MIKSICLLPTKLQEGMVLKTTDMNRTYIATRIRHSLIKVLALLSMALFLGCSSAPTKKTNELLAFPKPPDTARYYYQNTIISDLDVLKESEESKVNRWLTGIGQTGKPMRKPYGLAVSKGKVYVSDPPARMIRKYDFAENEYLEIGRKGNNDELLQKPFGLDIDDNGNIYVLDRTAGNIKIFDEKGVLIKILGDRKLYDMPTGLAVNNAGTRVYVSDTGGVTSERHHILEFDVASGEVLKHIGLRGSGEGELNLPKGLALSNNNELYVVDSGNFRIMIFDPDTGKTLRSFGSIGRKAGQFSRPKSIDVCANGIVMVSDAAFGNLQLFNEKGELLMFIGSRGNKLEPATYMLSSGVACDEDGRLFFADQFFRKIDVFRPATLKETDGYVALSEKK